jgi:3-oxoacyl-[acyl-carrier protein] reductase
MNDVPHPLAGQTAVVTGGSSGIGEAIAHALAREGVKVAVVASSAVGRAKAVCDVISAAGGSAQAFAADVRDEGAVRRLVREVEDKLGPIDILVNSAGVFYATPVGETPQDDLDRMIDINLKGTWNAISAIAPGMKARRHGRIINMASVAGVIGVKGFALYSASKAAVVMMTKALARELAPFDINVNAIAPGNTATPMNADLRTHEDPDVMAEIRRNTPSTTLFSRPEEIAALAVYLASPAARPIHGATIVADEGLSAGV